MRSASLHQLTLVGFALLGTSFHIISDGSPGVKGQTGGNDA